MLVALRLVEHRTFRFTLYRVTSVLIGRWQMRSSLKDQLSLEDLRKEFEKFADSKIARELPDFYKACLDREEIEDFFERQAATTAIIDRWDYEMGTPEWYPRVSTMFWRGIDSVKFYLGLFSTPVSRLRQAINDYALPLV